MARATSKHEYCLFGFARDLHLRTRYYLSQSGSSGYAIVFVDESAKKDVKVLNQIYSNLHRWQQCHRNGMEVQRLNSVHVFFAPLKITLFKIQFLDDDDGKNTWLKTIPAW